MADPSPLSRDQLAAFLDNHESIKRFERLFKVAGDLIPSDIQVLFRLVHEASIDAGTADAKAISTLAQLIQLAQDSAINSGAAESKANEALSSLNRIANALELLSVAPRPQEHTFLRGDYIDFPLDGPHVTQERRIQWNKDDGTIDVGLFNGVTLQVGQEMHYYAKNTSGVTITDGSAVMATGTAGASGKLTIGAAVSDGSIPAKYMLGIATQDIANNAFGYVTQFGLVRNINTTGAPYGEVWADGDVIYFSPTVAGGLTKVEPTAPDLKLPVAIVINTSAGAGSLFVRMTNGQYLHDCHDVIIAAPATGDLLRYNAVIGAWENVASTSITIGTSTNSDNIKTVSDATNATFYPTFVNSNNGVAAYEALFTDAGMSYNPSANILTLTGLTVTNTANASISGNAGSATNTGVTNDTTTNATMYPTWVTANTGNLPQKVSSTKLTFNPSTGYFGANGVLFNGDTAAANALDDYEEGTWTCTLYDASSGGNASTTTKTGYYTKIGNQVTIWLSDLNDISTAGMAAGNVLHFSLPFTANANCAASGTISPEVFAFPAGLTDIVCDVPNNGARGRFLLSGTGVANAYLTVAGLTTGVSDIERLTMTYFV